MSKKTIKVGILDAKTRRFRTEEVRDSLDEYYRIIGCDTIDIVVRNVNGEWFDIICDDEGLLQEEVIVTAINGDLQPMLVGTLIFAHHNAEGYMTGISDEDEELLRRSTFLGFAFPCEYEAM